MGITFNADEVFKMAERIEENAAAFYRKAAETAKASDETHLAFLNGLARMEDEHKATFMAMHEEIADDMREQSAFDPYMEATLYLTEMSDAHGGEGAPSAAEGLTGNETTEDIIRTGIDMEKTSIVFYLGIKDMVPEKLGKDKIDKIIAEEKEHLVILTRELKKL